MEKERDGRAGMTMLELLLVMFLLALLLGGGVGLLSALDLGKRQASGLVRNVLRSAQNTAIASHGPARARIDLAAGTIRAESLLTVGTYHFEEQRLTGYGPAGTAEPEHFDPRGFVGACFRPAGRLRAAAEIPVERDPGFDLTLGFSVECALFRETEDGGRVLSLGAGESPTLALDLGKNGGLRARLRTRLGDVASDRPGGSVILHSEPGLVPVGRWMQVRMRYDRARFELLLDGALVAAEEQDAFVWKVDAPLVLSDPAVPFPGRIDSLVIAVMVAGEPSRLPESVRFTGDSPETVQFAASGGLDRERHRDPPRIGLEFPDGTRETVTVGLYGTVE
jgi:type II secretory pathway pseudopilin PulG